MLGKLGKLVLYGGHHKDAVDHAPAHGFHTVVEVAAGDMDHLRAELSDANALGLRYLTVPADILRDAASLQVVSRHGVGTDNLDIPPLTERGIPLWITGDVNSNTVAEHAMMLMLATARSVVAADAMVRNGRFMDREGLSSCEVTGKTLLIVGFGRIGQRLAHLMSGLDMAVLVCDPFAQQADGIEIVSLTDGLSRADFISLHVPSDGAALITAKELSLMTPRAIVINTSRGDLIDIDALHTALQENRIGGAGLDVFPVEPPSPHALFDDPRITLTPHSAAMTEDCMRRMGSVTIANAARSLKGDMDASLIVNAADLGLIGQDLACHIFPAAL